MLALKCLSIDQLTVWPFNYLNSAVLARRSRYKAWTIASSLQRRVDWAARPSASSWRILQSDIFNPSIGECHYCVVRCGGFPGRAVGRRGDRLARLKDPFTRKMMLIHHIIIYFARNFVSSVSDKWTTATSAWNIYSDFVSNLVANRRV